MLLALAIFISALAGAQPLPDTLQAVRPADTLILQSYRGGLRREELPAMVHQISPEHWQQAPGGSMVQVMNQFPGIRMEERSPGSYRLSMRGSVLRSPFGVRNVKIYFQGFPLTDAGGNTYLNLMDPALLGRAEIVAGPAASFYGASTGGLLLLQTPPTSDTPGIRIQAEAGSYGAFRTNAGLQCGRWQLGLVHTRSSGYREQTALRKTNVLTQYTSAVGKSSFQALLWYTDLYYQTPGGLTRAQAADMPRQARPASATLPGAVAQQAGVYNKTGFAGLHFGHQWSPRWAFSQHIQLSHTSFRNPFITNEEQRSEWNPGARTLLTWNSNSSAAIKVQLQAGAEYLFQHAAINVYENNGGQTGALLRARKSTVHQGIGFLQGQLRYRRMIVQTGLSLNRFVYQIRPSGEAAQQSTLPATLAPRLAVNYRVCQHLYVFGQLSKGFSPPTLAELLPSAGNITTGLRAEYGWSREIGFKAAFPRNRGYLQASYYHFGLREALVRRNDSQGQEFFVNAGGTRQSGMETTIVWNPDKFPQGWRLKVQGSYSYQPYRFTSYRTGNTDYSGQPVTGIPLHLFSQRTDFSLGSGWDLWTLLQHSGALTLNDAGTEKEDGYWLLQARLSKTFRMGKRQWKGYAGADNLLNHFYSLGHDINAAGGRYFNPAPGRNYQAGLVWEY